MLVLSRKHQEQICIGDHIKITILRVKGKKVQLGIEAPSDVRILRAELPRFSPSNGDADETAEATIEESEPSESGVAVERYRSSILNRRPLAPFMRRESASAI